MITLTCTTCQRVLQIDDAFAGGVCRCQHCGTIQTVPAKSKPLGRSSAPTKTLYQKPDMERAEPMGMPPTRSARPEGSASPKRTVILVAVGAAALIIVAAVAWFILHRGA